MTSKTIATTTAETGTELVAAIEAGLPVSAAQALGTEVEPRHRLVVARYALDRVEHPDFLRPIPRVFATLPRAATDDEDVAWDIASRGLGSADPMTAAAGTGPKLGDMVGESVTVHDLAVRPLTEADLAEDPDRRIGGYLVLDVTTGASSEHQVLFTGSPQVIAPVVFAYCRGLLPHSWFVVEVAAAKGKRSAPLGLRDEPAL